MFPHGTKGSSKKASKSASMTLNGPRMSSKKKRKLLNENSDPDVLDRSSKYWHGLKIDASDDINEKILKCLSAPSHRYRLKEDLLPAKKKRKLQKNGSLETDSDEEKNSKKGRLQMKKKLLRKLNIGSKTAAISGTKNKSKKSASGYSCGKGKKSSRQKMLSVNYEDVDGVCIYDLDTPNSKNKTRKKKLMTERVKSADHLLNKKARVGKGVLTAKNLTKMQKTRLRIDAAKFSLLPKKQQKELQRKYFVQLVNDAEASDSDNIAENNISSGSCKQTKITKAKWADLSKKAKIKHLQDLELPKSKKLKRRQVSEEEDDDDSEDDDLSSEEEELSDDDLLEDEEEDLEDEDKDDDEEEEGDDDDDGDEEEDDSSDEQTSDEKLVHHFGLSKRVVMRYHDDKAVVIVEHPFECHLIGSIKLSVLSGCIKILGASLSADGQWHNVYSPSSHMLLKLTTVRSTGKDVSTVLNQLSSMFPVTNKFSNSINPRAVVLLVTDINWGFGDYITTLRPYQNIFQPPYKADKAYKASRAYNACNITHNKLLKRFGISLLKETNLVKSESSSEIDEFMKKWASVLEQSDHPKILVCGGKNVGKSTFARTLINITLETKKAVCFLDCDPGQTEFTPPGCISLTVVKEFILGPPFCHQQDPAFNIFFGEVSPDSNSNHYMMCIHSAIQYYQKMLEPLPLVINTMGWIQGRGKNMLDGILNLASPDHVVLLNSGKEPLQPIELHPLKVMENRWRFSGENLEHHAVSPCNWELTLLQSVVKRNTAANIKLSNADFRNLALLSYLGKNWSPGFSLSHSVPYKIKWNSLAIHVCHEIIPPSQILCAINACVVALCSADTTQAHHHNGDVNLPKIFQKRPICKCLGFGFVRGIQVESQMLYIVSPLPLNVISEVNTLMRGPLHLPLEKLQTQVGTDLMYVKDTSEKL